MREIGRIIRLQIQTSSLKKGDRLNLYYDPAAILSVPALKVMGGGVMGLVDGQEIIDVHHRDHQQSKNVGKNDVSINFTPHYERMQARFGPRLETGIAGENILVETADGFEVNDLQGGIFIETEDGRLAHLHQVIVDEPCVPFSEYALDQPLKAPPAATKETLQFLSKGTRGFYCTLNGEPIIVRVGDRVVLGD